MPQLNEQQAWELLNEGGRLATVATKRPDGRPHCVPVMYGTRDGEVVFSTRLGTVKLANLRHDPRVAVTVHRMNPHAFVMVEGEVAIEDDMTNDEKHNVLASMYVRYGIPYEATGDLSGSVIIRVRVNKIVGANFG